MIFHSLRYLTIWAQKTDHPAAKSAQPSDYDRVAGVTSVCFQESVRFGEENDPEYENEPNRAAHSSEDLDKTGDGEAIYHDANPGVDEI